MNLISKSVFLIGLFSMSNTYSQGQIALGGGIYINEFMASNSSTAIPNHAGFDDWIEIRNTYSTPKDLSGHYITDDLLVPTKFRFSTVPNSLVIPANGYIVIICSGNTTLGSNHVTFNLSSEGESIGLFAPDGTSPIDTYTFDQQRENISMGRNPVNNTDWKFIKNVTPKAVNNFTLVYDEIMPPPLFSQAGGFYTTNQTVGLSTAIPGATIYYTLDGSEPDINNLAGQTYSYKTVYPNGPLLTDKIHTYLYSTPLIITDRSNSPNRTSLKTNTPSGLVSKATVVRAIVAKTNALSSDPITQTYFVFPTINKYTLPVISIATSDNGLFDFNMGIYTRGVYYNGDGTGDNTCDLGNFSKEGLAWIRPANVEYFVGTTKAFGAPVKINIRGGCTRSVPRKALAIKSGSKFDYPVFDKSPNLKYDDLVLRNSGNDWGITVFKDAMFHDLVRTLNFGRQEATPCIGFVNGEYWGIHDLREQQNGNYLKEHYDINSDSFDMVKFTGSSVELDDGDMTAYNQLQSFLGNNNFSSVANYDSLKKLIDVNGFIDYQIAEIFAHNHDWPHNNVRLWRNKTQSFNPTIKTPKDGRWRWLMYDVDHGLEIFSVSHDGFGYAGNPNHFGANTLVKSLENDVFRKEFITRFADLLNTVFLPARTVAVTNEWKSKLNPEIEEHIARWRRPASRAIWEQNVADVVSFFNQRPNIMRTKLRTKFGLFSNRNLTIDVSALQEGYVHINTIDILPTTPGLVSQPYPWTGVYFQDVPVKITARAKQGYRFKHWLFNNAIVSTDTTLTLNLTANMSYKAIFEQYLLSSNPLPVAKILDKCGYKFMEWSDNTATGVSPANTAFVYFDQIEPTLSSNIEGFTSGLFNLTTRTRINGLNQGGIGFLNTSNTAGNIGYPGVKLGGLLVALNTVGKDSIFVSWTGGTIIPNIMQYAIRLQYRIGDIQAFSDVMDGNGQPIEYIRNAVAGHERTFQDIKLPQALMNEPYIQLLWRYYWKGPATTGARDQLRLDNINIKTKKTYQTTATQSNLLANYSQIESKATVIPAGLINYKASEYILLLPGFKTTNSSTFLAEIEGCN